MLAGAGEGDRRRCQGHAPCWPTSALVLGVNMVCGSFSLSCRPAGSGIEQMVPLFLYSSHPDPGPRRRADQSRRSRTRFERCAGALVVRCRARTRDVAADDGLDRQDAEPLDEHDAALELVAVLLHDGGHLCEVGGDDVVADDRLEQVEPEEAQLGEDLALARDALRGGDAVRTAPSPSRARL